MTTPATPTKPASRVAEVRGNRKTQRQTSPDVFEHNIQGLPEDQREILEWWFYHGRENDLSLKDLGRRAGISATSLSRAFAGNYGAELESLCARLKAAKDNLHQVVENPEFIMTDLARQMFEIFETARDLKVVTVAIGPKGIGKTTNSKEFKRQNNHGRTHYHRCSPGMTFGQFVTSLAASMGISSKRHSHLRLRGKIVAILAAGGRLLILDELHELFLNRARGRSEHAVLICEFIREIFDLAECGVVLVGTKTLLVELLEGENSAALEQLVDRGLDPIHLPAKPMQEDAEALIAHFGLPPIDGAKEPRAAQIIADVFQKSGLRKLTTHLRNGARRAAQDRQPYEWRHFVAAFDRLSSLSKKPALIA